MKKCGVILQYIGLGIAAILIIYLLSWTGLFENLEKFLDCRFKLREEEGATNEIIIVYIEEVIRASKARSNNAWLIGTCADLGAGAIGLDLLLHEAAAEEDKELEEALMEIQKNGKAKVYLTFGMWKKKVTNPEQIDKLKEFAWKKIPDLKGKLIKLEKEASIPLLGFCRYANGVGHAYLGKKNPEDTKEIIRRVPLLIEYKDEIYPYLALQILYNYLDIVCMDVKLGEHIKLVPRNGEPYIIPIDDKARMLINFVEKKKFPYSYTLNEFVGTVIDFDKSHIILVGPRVEKNDKGEIIKGKDDAHSVPSGSGYPGVAIQASVIDTILKRQFLNPAGRVTNIFLVVFLGFSLGGIIGTSRKKLEYGIRSIRTIRGMLLTIILSVVYLGIVVLFFKYRGVWVNVSTPLLVLIVTTFAYFLIGIYQCDLELRKISQKSGKEKVHLFLRFCLAGIIMIVVFIYALAKGKDEVVIGLLLLFASLVSGILTIPDLKKLLTEAIKKRLGGD